MEQLRAALDAIAAVLEYPGADLAQRAFECAAHLDHLAETVPASVEGARLLRAFAEHPAIGMGASHMEELYLQTFEMNPVRTLDLGWQLFGEDYNRGLFLVKVRQELRRAGIPETTELPDHATQVLKLVGRMEAEQAQDFGTSCVLPALAKTYTGIGGDCPYRLPVEAALHVLAGFCGVAFEDVVSETEHLEEAACHGTSV